MTLIAMTTGQIVYMSAVCGILWGGFTLCLVYLWRKDHQDPE